mgnify:CR=1 FL=1
MILMRYMVILRKYLSEEILNKYDKIFHLGHLSLYRNTVEMNTMFMNKIGDKNFRL